MPIAILAFILAAVSFFMVLVPKINERRSLERDMKFYEPYREMLMRGEPLPEGINLAMKPDGTLYFPQETSSKGAS